MLEYKNEDNTQHGVHHMHGAQAVVFSPAPCLELISPCKTEWQAFSKSARCPAAQLPLEPLPATPAAPWRADLEKSATEEAATRPAPARLPAHERRGSRPEQRLLVTFHLVRPASRAG